MVTGPYWYCLHCHELHVLYEVPRPMRGHPLRLLQDEVAVPKIIQHDALILADKRATGTRGDPN